jgi:hypothetical protein
MRPQNNEGREGEGAVEVKNAYEFTLEHIGHDLHAGLLWQEYIGFLQGCKPGSAAYTALYGAAAGADESQRTTTLRWAGLAGLAAGGGPGGCCRAAARSWPPQAAPAPGPARASA